MKSLMINDNFIIGICDGNEVVGTVDDITVSKILDLISNKPRAESGYDYKLRADTLEWELVELPPIDELQAYTAEQLQSMTNAELSAILTDIGISDSMTKANMITLILERQDNGT